MLWLTTILLTLTFGRCDLRTFASALFSANGTCPDPVGALNHSFPLNFQLLPVNLSIRSLQIGFPPSHPLKSPHRPQHER